MLHKDSHGFGTVEGYSRGTCVYPIMTVLAIVTIALTIEDTSQLRKSLSNLSRALGSYED